MPRRFGPNVALVCNLGVICSRGGMKADQGQNRDPLGYVQSQTKKVTLYR